MKKNLLIQFNKRLKFNLKFGFVFGLIGLLGYLIIYPFEKKNEKKYKYVLYDTCMAYQNYQALYIRTRDNIKFLDEYYSTNRTSELSYNIVNNLPTCNKAMLLDTIDGKYVKFRAKINYTNGESLVRGYTHISNIHKGFLKNSLIECDSTFYKSLPVEDK